MDQATLAGIARRQALQKLILDFGVQMRLVGMQAHLLEAGVHVDKIADANDAWQAIEAHLADRGGAARVP